MGFKDFKRDGVLIEEQAARYMTLTYLIEMQDSLNESNVEVLYEGINDKLNKIGLKIHKGTGILDYIKSFSEGSGKVFLALIKGDTKKAKEILQAVNKEDILDFIYKLDLGTLHLFTGPLHMIDAWTGWDLSANIKSHMVKAQSTVQIFKDALKKVRDNIVHVFDGGRRKSAEKALAALETGVGL